MQHGNDSAVLFFPYTFTHQSCQTVKFDEDFSFDYRSDQRVIFKNHEEEFDLFDRENVSGIISALRA